MIAKTDLKKTYPSLYAAPEEPCLVSVPELACFAVDGHGDPNASAAFQEAVEALYGASYALKFASKRSGGPDWTVLGLEGEWWCAEMATFSMARKDDWDWTLLVVQPAWVSEAEAMAAVEAARAKKGSSPALARLRFERRQAHRAAQLLHLGSYDEEEEDIRRLHAFIAASGLSLDGRHREVYLSDARKVEPRKLRTILRQPVSG